MFQLPISSLFRAGLGGPAGTLPASRERGAALRSVGSQSKPNYPISLSEFTLRSRKGSREGWWAPPTRHPPAGRETKAKAHPRPQDRQHAVPRKPQAALQAPASHKAATPDSQESEALWKALLRPTGFPEGASPHLSRRAGLF